MKKIVIASDSFKGSLTSSEIAAAATSGIMDIFPECRIICLNVGDGGEGTAQSLTEATKGESITIQVHDPIGRKISASYGITGKPDGSRTAIIEMAQASGLTLLEASERNPMLTSTYGTGEMIADALSRGCREFIVGIGGSATNDAGTGMLEALGFRFLDMEGQEIKGCCGGRLKDISSIDTSKTQSSLADARFIIACDVDNPLTGEEGATFTFARQKGADDAAIITLEEGMTSFCSLIRKTTGKDLDLIPGSGAAGGLGGAFIAFTDAELTRGADLILKMTGFDEAIKEADLIITGEGKIDNQTSRGKLPSAVLARSQRTPVVAIGGMVDLTDEEAAATGFEAVLPICPRPITEEDLRKAMDPGTAAANIRKTISSYLQKIND